MNNGNEEFENLETYIEGTNNSDKKITVPIIEEQITISKKMVDTAHVNLLKTVSETLESFDVSLAQEEIVITRIPKNEFVDVMPPATRYEGDIMIIPVLKEVAVIEKRIMLVEEIHVNRVKTEKTETHEVLVRKEEVNVNRTDL